MKSKLRIVLAYSGGLDTSIILKWLQENFDAEVVCYIADIGQDEDLAHAERKAYALGACQVCIEDLRDSFVEDYVAPMFRANALYESAYLLGTAIARPLIAKRQIELARELDADAVAHGATGKGNDQVRFELTYRALAPDLRVIAPWRLWDFQGREALLDWASRRQISVPKDKRGEAPFSVDANLLHISAEGKVLEDPSQEAPEFVYTQTRSPQDAPDTPRTLDIDFCNGAPCAIDASEGSTRSCLERLNAIGGEHAIGRLDLVENRQVGMKSRGIYETPGGTLWLFAKRTLESLTLDRELVRVRDSLIPQYAALLYNGLWFSPEREALQKLFDHDQQFVEGRVSLRLYKGSTTLLGRKSPYSLYSPEHATFEADSVFDQKDAEGFIKINALRLKIANRRKIPQRKDSHESPQKPPSRSLKASPS